MRAGRFLCILIRDCWEDAEDGEFGVGMFGFIDQAKEEHE